MSFKDYYQQPGHHQFVIDGPMGRIEIGLSVPEKANYDYFAIIGHPHPLQEGTMNNKVVTTTAKAIYALNIPVLRFNFRGVGQSDGAFDHGIGESADMLYLIKSWQTLFPNAKLLLSGFSFGSYVATLAAQQSDCQLLVLIAPPVGRFGFETKQIIRHPDVILMGTDDEVVEPKAVEDFALSFQPPVPIEWFEDTSHFFHGKLIALRDVITNWVNKCLSENHSIC
jgi:alpha/beta superfamily hydrolase